MKYKFPVACLLVGLLLPRVEAATEFYVNDGIVLAPPELPPQVDATNFVNNNYFSINFTNFFFPQLYETDNTLNFTNNGTMIGNTGFRFDWFVKTNVGGIKGHKLAANFVNNGSISSGSAANTNVLSGLFLFSAFLPKLQISATNVVLRSSTNIVGVDGLFNVSGKNVDLNRALIALEGFEDTPQSIFVFNGFNNVAGLSAGYWGVGTNVFNPANNFNFLPPFTPLHQVVTPLGGIGIRQLVLENATFHVDQFGFGTNRFVNAVFLSNTNPAIQNNVYFPFNNIAVVEWVGRNTNQVNGAVTTNVMYLTDDFGQLASNRVVTNFSYYTAAGTAQPINYSFSRVPPFFGLGAAFPPTDPAGVFDPVLVTNEFAAFGALFSPSTVNLDSLPPMWQFYTNLPGRIDISADSVMDLSGARIVGLNYMSLKSTNHVTSVSGAKISVPFSDISLGTTNGQLSLTNLLYPVVQRFTGEVDLYSARWTNDFGGLRTIYSVLFVDSLLSATAPSRVQDFTLRSTNIVISDIFNVTRNLMINAERVTLTTNQQPAATPRGELNLISTAITWSTSTPKLQYLTNNGGISSLNAVYLGGSRATPFYSSNFNEAYVAFVNRGTVSTEGSLIWADYFENSGQFDTRLGFGSISVQSLDARLTNGGFVAAKGDISIAANDLAVTNHQMFAGRKLTLSVTNSITDTGSSNANTWVMGRGMNLYHKPAQGDLRGTTVLGNVPPSAEAVSVWAGTNHGCVKEGFTNNVAIGRLILDGGQDSLFTFAGAEGSGVTNAIYIDYLELRNFITNRDAGGNFLGLQIDPNMKVYFAQAVMDGVSVAEKLDQQNGGRLCWVSDYAGIYSGTNVAYPDGTTIFLNAALVASCNLDSDGDGLVNCSDTTPVLRPQDLALAVSLVSEPAALAQVSWQSGPHAANTVYYKTNSSSSTPWQVLTNFATGPAGGRVFITDPVNAVSPRYYRVRVDSHQP